VKLMAKLIFLPIANEIESGTYLLYDGACGTGGMLTVAEETLQQLAAKHGKQVATHLYGQEINAETYANPLRGLFAAAIDGKPAVVEYEPDPDLRDAEQVPVLEDGGIEAFLRREVLPHAADAWYVPDSVKTGYEISFTRYFYKPQPLRTLEEIRADIRALEKETEGLLGEIIRGNA
jgi:type I restriction enzyme M protein